MCVVVDGEGKEFLSTMCDFKRYFMSESHAPFPDIDEKEEESDNSIPPFSNLTSAPCATLS